MSETIVENEQWKLNGDCNKCRRESYCSKDCSAKKRRDEYELAFKVNSVMCKIMGRFHN